MKKGICNFVLMIVSSLVMVASANAVALVWDEYTDPKATAIRVYQSTDSSTWELLIDNIPTNMVSTELPVNSGEQVRVYYIIRAVDTASSPEEESINSNIVSYFWTTGGGGHTGPAGVGGVGILDCDDYDIIPDDGSPEWGICNGRHNKP